jgi:hypothetical protein
MKDEKTNHNKIARNIFGKYLKDMQFNKQFRERKNAEPEFKVLAITPICKECASYIQSEMFRQDVEIKSNGEDDHDEKDKKPDEGIVNRLYNKVRKMKFM